MLRNKSTNQTVIAQVRIADSQWKRFLGLMFEKKENHTYGLVFDFGRLSRRSASVHMLFVFFPIDLVFLDESKRVVDIKRGFQPFSLNYTPKEKSRFLIELPAEGAKGISVLDYLEW